MPPVIILNALFCTDSRISTSVSVQLQNTIQAYSRPGRMNEVYIVVRVFLSNKYLSFARTFNFLSAFSLIVVMWSFHERFVLNSTPRCLCFTTHSNVILSKYDHRQTNRELRKLMFSTLFYKSSLVTSNICILAILSFLLQLHFVSHI